MESTNLKRKDKWSTNGKNEGKISKIQMGENEGKINKVQMESTNGKYKSKKER